MPFKGFNKCGRCRRNAKLFQVGKDYYKDGFGIYPRSELKIEIIDGRKMRITCPRGHTYISRSKSAFSYIRSLENVI